MPEQKAKSDNAAAGRTMNTSSAALAGPSREWRRIFAETWGTFLLVAAAAGGAIGVEVSPDKISYGMAVVAPGLTVMVAIYMLGQISGAHLNLAVTLAFATRGNSRGDASRPVWRPKLSARC